jgi:hypothetical protein
MKNILQNQKIGIDDWSADQDVEYILIAKVNDQLAYKTVSYDPDTIIDDVRYAEEQVAQLLNDQYIDATCPEYWSNDDEIYNV